MCSQYCFMFYLLHSRFCFMCVSIMHVFLYIFVYYCK